MSGVMILSLCKRVLFVFCCAVLLSSAAAHASTREQTAPFTGLNRAYVRLRPFVGKGGYGWDGNAGEWLGGVIADLGATAYTARGFLIGFELAPLTFTGPRPYISARLQLGYTNQLLSISMSVGSGLTWYFPNLGPIVRIGRFDRTYAIIRVSWAVYPVQPLPTDADLEVSTPIGTKVRADFNIGGSYNSNAGITVYALAGLKYALGAGGPRSSTLLGLGAGVAWAQFSLGPALGFSLERRF